MKKKLLKALHIIMLGFFVFSSLGIQTVYAISPFDTGMVAYWSLDQFIADSHGTNDAMNAGATFTGDGGKIDGAYVFDGAGQNIGLPTSIASDISGSGAITISTWVNRDSAGSKETILDYSIASGGYSKFNINFQADDKIRCGGRSRPADSYQNVITTETFSTGWYNVVCILDIANDDIKIYVNGAEKGTTGSVSFGLTAFDSSYGPQRYIGLSLANNYGFVGKIDEVGIWNEVLTPTEITSLYNSGNGLSYNNINFKDDLISYYSLDTDGTITDSFGSNDGTNIGAFPTADGKIIRAYTFTNYTDRIQVGLQSFASQAGSISAWVKLNADSNTNDNNRFIFSRNGAGDNAGDIALWISGDSHKIGFFAQDGTDVEVEGNLSNHLADTWYHVVATWDDTNTFLYINGEKQTDTDSGVNVQASASESFAIGQQSSAFFLTSQEFDGIIDEVGLWDVALTEGDVTSLYNSGSALAFQLGGGAGVPEFSTYMYILTIMTAFSFVYLNNKNKDLGSIGLR